MNRRSGAVYPAGLIMILGVLVLIIHSDLMRHVITQTEIQQQDKRWENEVEYHLEELTEAKCILQTRNSFLPIINVYLLLFLGEFSVS